MTSELVVRRVSPGEWVFEANERAVAFYRLMGFRATETTMYQPHRPDDRELLMVRELT